MADDFSSRVSDSARIRLRGLHLTGVTKDYHVSFEDETGRVRPLSIIAGEISTGKTSILELIDYCLGASQHPQHEEIIQSVRGVRLGLQVQGLVLEDSDTDQSKDRQYTTTDRVESDVDTTTKVTEFVLERAVPGPSGLAFLFRGTLDDIEPVAPRRLNTDPNSEESISQFLLSSVGLGGLRLRSAPTKADSPTSILSFRDVTPLYFLTHRRLDNGNLVLEHQPFRQLKLQQVVDYFFGVSDEALSNLAAQIDNLTKRRNEAKAGIRALRAFLRDHGVTNEIALDAEATEIQAQLRQAEAQFEELDQRIQASTHFASAVRSRYEEGARRFRAASAELRDRETLLARLNPLRSQYADDLRKMTMLLEARRLFDPLSVTVCPACQSNLKYPPKVVDSTCTLCNSAIPHLVDEALSAQNGVKPETSIGVIAPGDLDGERRSISARLNELTDFMTQIEEEAASLRAEVRRRDDERAQLQLELDSVTRDAISPFLTERDSRGREVARMRANYAAIQQRLHLLAGLEQRVDEEERIAGSLQSLRERLRELNEANTTRDSVINAISQRFSSILSAFGFPKLNNAYVNTRLLPFARTVRYDQIGSSGAMTLLSLAWQLAIFELSVERGAGHPGFLMIDSPQKNLKAKEGSEWDVEMADSIVDRIYRHVLDWLSANGSAAQVIIVDNAPPHWVDDHVIVRYSGRPDVPPYGLIDDAVT